MKNSIRFRPRLPETLKNYTSKDLTADLVAGVTVGIVALPLAMAFAIASGVKPEAGIFTAVIAGFIISALGGTKVSIGGPTGAFIVILLGIGTKYGFDNLVICTILFGIVWITNAAIMLASPKLWFRLPSWTGVHGIMTERKYGNKWGFLQIRILGGIFLVAGLGIIYHAFSN